MLSLFFATFVILFAQWAVSDQETVVHMLANKSSNSVEILKFDDRKKVSSDTKLVRRIRYAIKTDEEVSSCLRDVKITSLDGKVKIKGLVATEVEGNKILDYASSVAGYSNVVNELTVVPLRND